MKTILGRKYSYVEIDPGNRKFILIIIVEKRKNNSQDLLRAASGFPTFRCKLALLHSKPIYVYRWCLA